MDELKEALGLDLSPQQRAFAVYYVQSMGNGPESAWRAYDCTTRGSARAR